MSHERYTLEQRTENHWRNPGWEKFSSKQYRYPSAIGEALLVEGVNCLLETAQELAESGLIFPIETAQPTPAVESPTVNLSQKNGGDINGL